MQMKLTTCHICSHCIVNRKKKKKDLLFQYPKTMIHPIPQRSHTDHWWMSEVPTHLHCFTFILLVNVNIHAGITLGEPGVTHLSAVHSAELKCVIPCLVRLLLFLKPNPVLWKGLALACTFSSCYWAQRIGSHTSGRGPHPKKRSW